MKCLHRLLFWHNTQADVGERVSILLGGTNDAKYLIYPILTSVAVRPEAKLLYITYGVEYLVYKKNHTTDNVTCIVIMQQLVSLGKLKKYQKKKKKERKKNKLTTIFVVLLSDV